MSKDEQRRRRLIIIFAGALVILCSYPVVEGALYPTSTTGVRVSNDWRLIFHRQLGLTVVQVGPLIFYSRPRVPGTIDSEY